MINILKIDITEQRFGRLVAKEPIRERGKKTRWICICDCGETCDILQENLISGNTKSCGCIRIEMAKSRNKGKTNMSKTKIYEKWKCIRYKCRNELHPLYDSFGAKGIKVCKEWDESFDAFYKWSIENGYRSDLSIERIDKNGDYCPENCKWVSRKEIECKKRKNFIEISGIKKPIKDWTDFMGWEYTKHQMRFYRGKEVFNKDEIQAIEEKLRSENND